MPIADVVKQAPGELSAVARTPLLPPLRLRAATERGRVLRYLADWK